ncbi:phage protein Gp27 family protein [Brucella rhizosphaerae]|uniref:phage protein Gp27 family protein n=1 Tax=Brucella rhizosphaerae TaxID=571254 RepID=UPI00046753CB|nr:phage protein Gp27 family protein [Brucella rhizosphaerae]
MAEDRRGRSRLDSLEQLPEDAQDDVIWAISQLNERRRSQADILFELNDRLEVKGIGPISKSAFNRKAMRLSRRASQLEERRFIYAGIAEKLTPEEISKSDIVLGEFLKTLIDELLDGDGLNSKNAMELARAYKETVVAQRHSAEHRRKAEEEAKAKLAKAVGDATDAVEKAGRKVDGEEILRMIREAYGTS